MGNANKTCQMEIVYATAPSADNARYIAVDLLKSGLVACINIIRSSSVYSCENELKMNDEYVMIIKTDVVFVQEVMERVKKCSEYEIPAVFSLPINKVDLSYLQWLSGVLGVHSSGGDC